MAKITILSEIDNYRLHCKLTTETETFCERTALSLVYINTIEKQLPPGYFCHECYDEAIKVLKESYPNDELSAQDDLDERFPGTA